MTGNQIKRILNGLNKSTGNNVSQNLPEIRTIILETKQGISADTSLVTMDYSHSLLNIKEYNKHSIMLPLNVYKVDGNIIYYANNFRVLAEDYIYLQTGNNIILLGHPTLSNGGFYVDGLALFNMYADNRLVLIRNKDYQYAIPAASAPNTLISLTAVSDNAADTILDMTKIVAFEMRNGIIGSYGV